MRTAGQGPGGFEKRDGFIKPGQDLVVAGYAGMAGARLIFQKKKEKLEDVYKRQFKDCTLVVSQNGREIARKKMKKALPAEMIHIDLKAEKLKNKGDLEVKVE